MDSEDLIAEQAVQHRDDGVADDSDLIGVLLVNLGTPDAPSASAVRRYLAEFLSDRRVVDLPRFLWLPLLHGVILNVRPGATARNYKKIWRAESNESPLRFYTRAQAGGLALEMQSTLVVDWAMRYGSPSIRKRINVLVESGCKRLVFLPLYPQYSATTTASVCDAIFCAISNLRDQPAIRIAPAFYRDDAYIDALAGVARRQLASLSWRPEQIILSYHGLPQRYCDAGDPYFKHCSETSRLLRAAMGWTAGYAPMTFQSKFGREKWLEPATEGTVKAVAAEGVKNIAIMAPSFVSDCIETLEELDIAAREAFISAGGENFFVIPCLNDSPEMIGLLESVVRRETAGWAD